MKCKTMSGDNRKIRWMAFTAAVILGTSLFAFVPVGPGASLTKAAEPAYKGWRREKKILDPDKIPDPFLSYLIKRREQSTLQAEKEKEKQLAAEEAIKREKQAAAQMLKELLTPKTELQKLSLSQLTLSAIVQADDRAWAMVRDPKGRGYILTKGTRIGTNGGTVDRIVRKEKKVVIKEPYLEDELHLKYREVEIKLPEQVYE
ncbi:MAG: pilus assembly protein PilP [Deltaproteobacteria bacterium]|nr:pilus assembly protein PilP [Deltaproteobacteria bacterium]